VSLSYLIATGFGSGKSRYIPGTTGTAGCCLLYLIPLAFGLEGSYLYPVVLALVITPISFPVTRNALRDGEVSGKDPREVVIDEWAGYSITLLGHPLGLTQIVAGFFLFRLFDILKPSPARNFEKLPGEKGIIVDDLVAGLYANFFMSLLFLWT